MNQYHDHKNKCSVNVSIRKHAHAHTDIHTEHSEKGEVNFEEQIFTMARINKFREISWFWPKFTEILQNLLPLRYSVCDFFSNVLIIVDKSTIKWNSSAYKRRNIDIWVVATSNQLCLRGFLSETKFSKKKKKKKKVTGKTPFFVIGPFCTHHSNYLDIGF